MTWPPDLTTKTVTSSYPNAGPGLNGYVSFVLTADLADATAPAILRTAPIQAQVTNGVMTPVVLPCTDNTDLSPSGWAWTVTEVLQGAPTRIWSFFLPHTLPSTVDLASLTPLVTPPTLVQYLLAANNLSDLPNPAAARTALGLGTGAVANIDTTAADFQPLGTAAAGATGKVADAGHVHPVTTSNVQTFTSNGTWTKPANATVVTVILIGAGGGGGSGAVEASGTVASGGAGGGGGGFTLKAFPASLLSATESVTVSTTGGTGGTAVGTAASAGNAGGAGGASTFKSTSWATAAGGSGGAGGTTGAASGGTGGVGSMNGGTGASSSATGAAGGTGSTSNQGGSGGGAGGGIATTPASVGGGAGGIVQSSSGNVGGAAGASGGGAGGAGNSAGANAPVAGTGGGGGGSLAAGAGGAGGLGGNYGGGGGGGAGAVAGQNSGAGGNGAGGLVIVISEI